MPIPERFAEQIRRKSGAFARGGVSEARVDERSRGCDPGKLDVGGVVEIDILADPERLSRLDLSAIEG
jgi:hypothetical protein